MEPLGCLWQLSLETQSRWESLERGLRTVAQFLLSDTGWSRPLGFESFRLPSEYGSFITLPTGVQLWDDDLSEAELDLICGVYRVYTGKFSLARHLPSYLTFGQGQGEQVASMSWWPKHSTWVKSGLNVGYWSKGCEAWFLRRFDAICSGSTTLKTTGQWREALRMFAKTRQLVASNEYAAQMYLNNQL